MGTVRHLGRQARIAHGIEGGNLCIIGGQPNGVGPLQSYVSAPTELKEWSTKINLILQILSRSDAELQR